MPRIRISGGLLILSVVALLVIASTVPSLLTPKQQPNATRPTPASVPAPTWAPPQPAVTTEPLAPSTSAIPACTRQSYDISLFVANENGLHSGEIVHEVEGTFFLRAFMADKEEGVRQTVVTFKNPREQQKLIELLNEGEGALSTLKVWANCAVEGSFIFHGLTYRRMLLLKEATIAEVSHTWLPFACKAALEICLPPKAEPTDIAAHCEFVKEPFGTTTIPAKGVLFTRMAYGTYYTAMMVPQADGSVRHTTVPAAGYDWMVANPETQKLLIKGCWSGGGNGRSTTLGMAEVKGLLFEE
jgi:hypothetical protein